MNRLSDAWFEFGGVRSSNRNVRILAMPDRPHPAAKGELVEIPGRNGALWMPEEAWESMTITVRCATMDGYSVDAIGAWLNGSGELRFSDEPDRIYRARVKDSFTRGSRFLSFDEQVFDVPFTCDPLRYKYLADAAADDMTIYSTATVTNPGTVYSAPCLMIYGGGDASLNVGGHMVDITDMTGNGIMIDSELMDCFDLTGGELQNSKVSMEAFPRLEVGSNVIAWDGGIARVVIRPRWRYL